MKNIYTICALALVAAALLSGCGKDGGGTPAGGLAFNVYLAGTYTEGENDVAAYWKDGQKTVLSIPAGASNSSVGAIALAGGKVYTAGNYWLDPDDGVSYWVDNARTDMPEGSVMDIAVASGGQVYCAGNYDWPEIPCYWAGTVRHDLAIPQDYTNGMATSIAVSDGVVYAGGHVNITPCCWTVGEGACTILPMPDDATLGTVSDIAVSDDIVYALGWYMLNSEQISCYWADGQRVELSVPDTYTYCWSESICVAGGKVYVAGIAYSDGSGKPCYWEDNVLHILDVPGDAIGALPGYITVVEGKVCVAGYYYIGGQNKDFTCYWIDGQRAGDAAIAESLGEGFYLCLGRK